MATLPTDSNYVVPADMNFAAAIGAIKGYTPFRKFGVNAALTGTADVWGNGGTLVWPDVAGVVSVVSSDAADTDGSTGAHQVTIVGLDADYNTIQETVNMTGLTPAVTTASFLRANRMFIGECGSSDSNVGVISASIGGNVQETIRAGDGQSAVALYTVPAGYTFLVNYYSVGVGRMAGTADCNIKGQIRLYDPTVADPSQHQGWRTISNIYLYNGQQQANSTSWTVIPEKTDMRIRATLSSGTTQVDGIFGGFLVEKNIQGNF